MSREVGSVVKANGDWPADKLEALDGAIRELRGEQGSLIAVLQRAQDIFGYLPEDIMKRIARGLRVSASKVFGVATFYAQFSFVPRGRHTVLACQGTACHVRGGDKIMEEMLRDLDVEKGGTTEDGRFTVEEVYCIGCCSLAPAIVVDQDVHGQLTPKHAKDLLKDYDGRRQALRCSMRSR